MSDDNRMNDPAKADTTPAETAPWRHPLRPSELAARKPTRLTLAPEAPVRAALAADLGILEIRKLSFKVELTPQGRHDWQLSAQLGATVVQECILTLAPVTTRLDLPITRRYLADMPEPEGDEVEMPEDDTLEPLPEVIDLGDVMAEALALALPDYPRAEGASLAEGLGTPPGAEALTEDKLRPFANLAALIARKDDTPDSQG